MSSAAVRPRMRSCWAMLTPIGKLRNTRPEDSYFERLALLEESKSMPWADVYNYFCMQNGVPAGGDYIADVEKYEREVTSKR